MKKTKKKWNVYPLFLWFGMLLFAASSSVIAKLGQLGAMNTIDGRNPISFCNVLFVANVIAGITLFAIYRKVWTKENLSKLSKKDWGHLIVLAFLSGFLSPTLFFLGLMLTEVINVVLISVVDIPLTLIFTYWLLGDRPSKGALWSALFSIAGISVIFLLHTPTMPMEMKMKMVNMGNDPIMEFLVQIPFAGGVCVLLATLANSFAIQYSKKVIRNVPLGIFSVFRTLIGAVLFFIIVLVLFGPMHFIDVFDPFLLEWMLFYGIGIVGFGLYIWLKGIQKSSNSDLSFSNAFQPVAGVIFAYLILGEIPDYGQIIGGVIILTGIFIGLYVETKKKKAPLKKPPIKTRYFSGC